MQINFQAINQAALPHLEVLCRELIPGGTMKGREYSTGDLTGGLGNSCKFNVDTGKWADFATGEKGGDCISYCAAAKKIPQSSAARIVADSIGQPISPVSKSFKRKKVKSTTKPRSLMEDKEPFPWTMASRDNLEHAVKYFAGREIKLELPVCIRGGSYRDKETGQMVHVIVVAMSRPGDPRPSSIQRIFIDTENNTKTGTKMLGSCKGGAAWFDREGDHTTIFIVEGTETGLSIRQATRMNGGVAMSTSGMRNVIIPDETKNIYICVDTDPVREKAATSMPGQKAGYHLAQRIKKERPGCEVYIVTTDDSCLSDKPKKADFNDLLQEDPTGQSIRDRFGKAIKFEDLEWEPPTDKKNKQEPEKETAIEREVFDRYVFLASANKIIDSFAHDIHESMMVERAFALLLAGKIHRYRDAKGKLQVMPLAKYWLQSEDKKIASSVLYSPGSPLLFKNGDGRTYYNTFRFPYEMSPLMSDRERGERLKLWHKIMTTVFHVHKGDMEDWFSFSIQNPAERSGIMPVCISDVGLGKTLIMSIMGRVVGLQNYSNGKILDVTGLGRSGTQWGDWIFNKILSCIEEIDPDGESGISYKVLDALKDIITNETLSLNLKGGRNGTFPVYSNIIGFSNHSDCMKIPYGDRRIFVVDSTGQTKLDSHEYKEIWDWMGDDQNIIAVYQYLLNREISKDFIPGQAKMTTAKRDMQADGRSLIQTAFDLVLKQYPCDLVTSGEMQLAVAQALHYLEGGEGEVSSTATATGFNNDKQYNAILKSMTSLWGGGSRIRVQRSGQGKYSPSQVRVIRNKADWASASNNDIKESMNVKIPWNWIMEDDEIPF